MEYPDIVVLIEPGPQGPVARAFTVNGAEDKVWIVNKCLKVGAVVTGESAEPLTDLPSDIREQVDSAQEGFTDIEDK